jgi:hypothetical protein
MKKTTIIKLLITVFFFLILFYKIDIRNIVNTFQSLNIHFLVLAFLMVPLLTLVRAWRWQVILNSTGIIQSFRETLKITLIGTFYGLITPGKIGEFGRAIHVKEKKSITIPTIIMEKLLDIGVLLVLSVITVFQFFRDSPVFTVPLFLILIGVFLGIFLSVNERFLIATCKRIRISQEDIRSFVDTQKKMMANPQTVVKTTIITIAYYFIAYCFAFFIVISGNMQFDSIFVMPIVVLIGNIPITISGLGLRESIGSLCFVLLGESAGNGFIFSLLLFLFITVLPAVCGYLISMTEVTNNEA